MTATIPREGAQVLTDDPHRVGLVAADPVRVQGRASRARPGDSRVIHQDREHRRVSGVVWSDEDHQGKSRPSGTS
ncbi:hypothetical protein [Arthrobacter cheniae]|uniref:hypothetical protein n=1 Tax=Arthrobacter cheniae TaxID=1258888 RepID=UPI0011C35C40